MLSWHGERGAERRRRRRERSDIDRQRDDSRAIGYAAFVGHDWNVDVLDLVFDSLVDTPSTGLPDEVRRLRFVGDGCSVEADVRGYTSLTVDLRVSPAGLFAVEARRAGSRGEGTTLWPEGQRLTRLTPGLTSFHIRWPLSQRLPARTAWVLL